MFLLFSHAHVNVGENVYKNGFVTLMRTTYLWFILSDFFMGYLGFRLSCSTLTLILPIINLLNSNTNDKLH